MPTARFAEVTGWDWERVPAPDPQIILPSDGPTWEDIKSVWRLFWKDERLILSLMREGKGPTAIAHILRFRDKKHAHIVIGHVLKVASFLVRHREARKRLKDAVRCLSPNHRRVCQLLVRRRTVAEIAREVGYTPNGAKWAVRLAVEKLRKHGHGEVADMVAEAHSTRTYSDNPCWVLGRRRRQGIEQWRQNVVSALLGSVGRVRFEDESSDYDLRQRCGTADAAGLVVSALAAVHKLPAKFRERSVLGLARHYRPVKSPLPGDLVFYGRAEPQHVMFFTGEVDCWTSTVIGIVGGRPGMTPREASVTGAGLWLRNRVKYRTDFLGYRRVR